MKLIVAVSGSIAAYKSYDFVRGLVHLGHDVKVIMTKGAQKLINPNLFSYLGAEEVFTSTDDFKKPIKKSSIPHIDLANWCDGMVVIPASANTISKLSLALTSDLLGSTFLALGNKKTIIVPAMNSKMWRHPLFQERLNILLTKSQTQMITPDSGLLACGENGIGKLPDVNTLLEVIPTFFSKETINKTVLISTGATVAPLDPVRYLTNPSSGKTGLEIAKAFLLKGYRVEVVVGHNPIPAITSLALNPNAKVFHAPTTQEMERVIKERFKTCDLFISAAAVADVEFKTHDSKIKKSDLHDALPIKGAVDILAEVLKIRTNQKVVSFAAETTLDNDVYMEKIQRKPVDLMVGNVVHSGLMQNENIKGFQVTSGQYRFYNVNGPIESKTLTKFGLGEYLGEWYANHSH